MLLVEDASGFRGQADEIVTPHSEADVIAFLRRASETATPVTIRPGETRYAGAMLLHVALSQLGLWAVFQTLGASVGRTTLSVRQVVGVVAMGFAMNGAEIFIVQASVQAQARGRARV